MAKRLGASESVGLVSVPSACPSTVVLAAVGNWQQAVER